MEVIEIDISSLDIRFPNYGVKCVQLYRGLKRGIKNNTAAGYRYFFGSKHEGVFREEQIPLLEKILEVLGIPKSSVTLFSPLLGVEKIGDFKHIPVNTFENTDMYGFYGESNFHVSAEKRFTLFLGMPKPFRTYLLHNVYQDELLRGQCYFTYRFGTEDLPTYDPRVEQSIKAFFGVDVEERELPRITLPENDIRKIRQAGLVDLCCETYFNYPDHYFFTEKTLAAVAFKQPIIFFSESGTLKAFQQLGYRTFSKFWDESYDSEIDPVIRFNKAFSEVKRLSNLSDLEFLNLKEGLQEVVEYNLEILRARSQKYEQGDVVLDSDKVIYPQRGDVFLGQVDSDEMSIWKTATSCRTKYVEGGVRVLGDNYFLDLI